MEKLKSGDKKEKNLLGKKIRFCKIFIFDANNKYRKTLNCTRGYYSFFRPLGAGIIQGRVLLKGGYNCTFSKFYPQKALNWLIFGHFWPFWAILQQMRALFEGGYNSSSEGKRCGYNLRAGTIKGRVQLKALRYIKLKLAHKIGTNCVFAMVLTRFCSLHTTHYLVIELSNQIVWVLEVASPRKLSDQFKLASSEWSLLVYWISFSE